MLIDKTSPGPDWVKALRRRLPVDPEVDAVLSRKLALRPGPGFRTQSLPAIVRSLTALIAEQHDGPFEIREPRWLTGGASKIQVRFDLFWSPDGGAMVTTPLVLRMEPAASVCETSRRREFALLAAMKGVVPVPRPYWVDHEARHFAYPALVYAFAGGVTKPQTTTSNVSGLGTNLGAPLRAPLAEQFIQQLAAIHRHDITAPLLAYLDVPAGPTGAAEWALNWWERVWEEDSGEDVPLMRLAAAWMRANLPHADRLSVIHADYRTGNFLFDEASARITAWLDWELGHIGDPHEDLAWSLSPAFGHHAEDGSAFLVCGLMAREDFLARYTAASGIAVDPDTLHFYEILSAYKAIVIVLGAGYRNARLGKSHQDVLLVWLMGLAASLLGELARLLQGR